MISATGVVDLLRQRRSERGPYLEAARLISQHYNNEIAIPLPEAVAKEQPAVANFIAQGIDQHAMRISSVLPDVDFPPEKAGSRAQQQAKDRRIVAYGWFEQNAMELFNRKRARNLIAYGGSAVEIIPDTTKLCMPRWHLRSPLDTYPAAVEDDLDYCPPDVIFTFTRSWSWLRSCYPDAYMYVRMSLGNKPNSDDELVEFAKYVDGEETVLVCTGKGDLTGIVHTAEWGVGDATIINLGDRIGSQGWALEIERYPNILGRCPVVMPNRISLGHSKGQFDDTTGIFQMLGRMMSLEVNAVSRAVYPDTWFVRNAGGQGRIITPADGLRGIIGEVEDGQVINLAMQPGYQTRDVINMLERNLRLNGALPAEFGGESASNVRTDRRGQSVLSAAVDYHIDEHQKILARAMKFELDLAADVDKAYWRRKPQSFYVSWGGQPGRAEYVPAALWEGEHTPIVSYPFAGMDINAITVAIGQQIGVGVMSKQTAMEKLSTVDDPEQETRRIAEEGMEIALLSGFQAQAQSGQIPPTDIARILELMRNERLDFVDAVIKTQKEAQERQASVAPDGSPAVAAPGSPEAQPGLAVPGAGAEVPTGGPDSPEGLSGMRALLNSLTAGASLADSGTAA